MKLMIKYSILPILFLSMTNCSSSFYTLTPDEISQLEEGREIIEKEDRFAYSSISFEDHTGDDFVFHLFVYNKEQEDFIFDPAEITIKFYDKNKNLLNNNDIYAIDPEQQINNLDRAIKERDNSHNVSTGFNVAVALLSTIVDLTDGEDNNAEEVLENVIVFADNQIGEEVSYENDVEYLKANKLYWKNEVLRKTELTKKEGVDGVVFIPFNEQAKYIKIYIPLGKTVHKFKYLQIKH